MVSWGHLRRQQGLLQAHRALAGTRGQKCEPSEKSLWDSCLTKASWDGGSLLGQRFSPGIVVRFIGLSLPDLQTALQSWSKAAWLLFLMAAGACFTVIQNGRVTRSGWCPSTFQKKAWKPSKADPERAPHEAVRRKPKMQWRHKEIVMPGTWDACPTNPDATGSTIPGKRTRGLQLGRPKVWCYLGPLESHIPLHASDT